MPGQLVLVLGAPSDEVKMLCWLVFGEHEALQGDMPKSRNLSPTQRKPKLLKRTDHSQANLPLRTALPAVPQGAQILCWLMF